MKRQFTEIAKHYDDLMAGVPYRYWAEYVEDILKHLDYHPLTVLDAACGTGNVSEILAEFGYEVTGVDISPEMIEVAKSKPSKCDGIEYIVQDISEMYLGRTFDCVISLFDSLNYIVDPEKLQDAMIRIANHLCQGGVFVFDVNTEYALAHGFFNQANLESRRYPKYIWSSSYNRATRICAITMAFEVMEDGQPRQFTEIHNQRGYSSEELEEMIMRGGMELVESFHAYSFGKPRRRSDRVFYVARKSAGS